MTTSPTPLKVSDLCSCCQVSKHFKSQSLDCGHGRGPGPGPLQRILLLNPPGLTVWRRLLPAPRAARSLRAVLAVQRRSCRCALLPVALGHLVTRRERVRPAESRYTSMMANKLEMHLSYFLLLIHVAESILAFCLINCCKYCVCNYD